MTETPPAAPTGEPHAASLDRRRFGLAAASVSAGLFAGGMAPMMSAPATAATPKALPSDPRAINTAHRRIFGTSEDGGRVIIKTKGIVFGILPTGVTALYGFRGTETGWWKKVDDDTWIRYPSTLSFFTDLKTGKFVDEVYNPYKDKMVKVGVSFIRHKEGEVYTPTGHAYASMKKAFPDVYKDEPLTADWSLDGDTIRLRSGDNFPPILPEPSIEFVTIFARASEVFDERVKTPWSAASGWNLRAWATAPWLEMGDSQGATNWHFDAVKVSSEADLDADYLERAKAHTNLFDKSPEFDEGPSFFERILERRRQQTQPPAARG